MKQNIAAILFGIMAMYSMLTPMSAMAENQTVEAQDGNSFAVTATASVTDVELEQLGLNVVVSFPTEISLTLDENKKFTGSDTVYAYGIMDSQNTVSVSINTLDNAYGKILHTTEAGIETDSLNNFFATVTEELSKESFSAEETKSNYLNMLDSAAIEHYGTLEVAIENLIPTEGTGSYCTEVPLIISVQ